MAMNSMYNNLKLNIMTTKRNKLDTLAAFGILLTLVAFLAALYLAIVNLNVWTVL